MTNRVKDKLACISEVRMTEKGVAFKWTGHSDYKSMKPYIDIATKTKSDAMQKIADSWEDSE